MICPHCGRDSDPLFKFCLHCGKELGAAKKAPRKPAAPAPAPAPVQKPVQVREPEPVPEPMPAPVPEPELAFSDELTPPPDEVPQPLPASARLAEPASAAEPEPEPEPVDEAPPAPASQSAPDLAAPVRCPRCRAKLSPDSPVCRLCGYRVEEAPAQSAAAPGLAEPKPTSEQKTLKDNVGYLISVSSVDGRETVKMPIKKGVNTLGRGKCDLPFQEDDLLSPVHLRISVDEDGAMLSTSESRNGTFLRMTDQVQLKHGDQFRLGQQLLRFEDLNRLGPIVTCPDGEDDTQILGSPGGPKAWGRLTQVVSESLTASSFLLTSENVFLGRERGNITFPGDRYISGTHAVVTRKADGTYLRDVGSSNGTYVRLKGDVRVASGQYFLAGRQLFKLYLEK